MRYAVINADNKVVNIILWNGLDTWQPPRGCKAIICEGLIVHPGDSYDAMTKTFIPNPKRLGSTGNQ